MKKRVLLACALLAFVLAVPTVAMAKTSTKLSVSLTSPLEHYKIIPVMTGTLKTSKGVVLKGKTVSLYYNGTKVASKTTNSKGQVSFTLRTHLGDMQASWNLGYAGSSTYGSSTSSKKSTMEHLHYFALNQVPLPYDINSDGTDEYVIFIDLFLPKGTSYYIGSSVATVRSVYRYGAPDTDLYTSTASQTSGDVAITEDDFYQIRVVCPDEYPISVMVY